MQCWAQAFPAKGFHFKMELNAYIYFELLFQIQIYA